MMGIHDELPAEPPRGSYVRDIDGDVYMRTWDGWRVLGGTLARTWANLLEYGPLDEVLLTVTLPDGPSYTYGAPETEPDVGAVVRDADGDTYIHAVSGWFKVTGARWLWSEINMFAPLTVLAGATR